MGSVNKACRSCGEVKDTTGFYKAKNNKDGVSNTCKLCACEASRKNREENIDRYLAYDKERYLADPSRKDVALKWKRENPELAKKKNKEWVAANPDKIMARHNRWAERYPEKKRAHWTVANALRDGRLTKRPCEACRGEEFIHAHHADYSKPLDVIWLCGDCHRLEHEKINSEKKGTRCQD